MQQNSTQTLSAPAISPKQQLIATCAAFFILGAAFATWASRIPAIRDISMLTPVTLGYVLLGKGIGTVIIMPAVTAAIHRFGAKKTAFSFGLVVILTLIFMAVSPSWQILAVVLFVAGASASGYNISINALGAKIEARTGRSHMSTIHSWFGVGNFAGALIGTGLASQQFTAASHFWGMSLLLIIVLMVIYKYLPDDEPNRDAVRAGFKIPHGGLIWLGAICFLAASIEESINNWVALFFTDHIGTSAGLAPVGYAAYAGSLLLMRLIGDRLKPRFGAKTLLTVGSIIAACGIILAILSTNVWVAALGFVAAGAGVALTFPMVFSAAGKEGAVALASVATMGYIGGMASQPLMGFLVDNFEISGGFTFIVICMLIIAAGSWKANLLDK
ncbi:MAG: MFS transporter [Gracilimonas sp.]